MNNKSLIFFSCLENPPAAFKLKHFLPPRRCIYSDMLSLISSWIPDQCLEYNPCLYKRGIFFWHTKKDISKRGTSNFFHLLGSKTKSNLPFKFSKLVFSLYVWPSHPFECRVSWVLSIILTFPFSAWLTKEITHLTIFSFWQTLIIREWWMYQRQVFPLILSFLHEDTCVRK